jgi:diketogulonate reductase-like aldo/keto reductase
LQTSILLAITRPVHGLGLLTSFMWCGKPQQVGKTGAQVLIRWSLQHGFVPLPKSDKAERIQENFDVFSFELDSESMAQLDSLDQGDAGAISWNPTRVD